jgi:hypothetical protein
VRLLLALLVPLLLIGCDRGPVTESNQSAIEARAKLLEQVANASVDASIAKIARETPDAEIDSGAPANEASDK